MWEPRRLATLWASTACYRYSYIFYSLVEKIYRTMYILVLLCALLLLYWVQEIWGCSLQNRGIEVRNGTWRLVVWCTGTSILTFRRAMLEFRPSEAYFLSRRTVFSSTVNRVWSEDFCAGTSVSYANYYPTNASWSTVIRVGYNRPTWSLNTKELGLTPPQKQTRIISILEQPFSG
jgi:hypothetical protein